MGRGTIFCNRICMGCMLFSGGEGGLKLVDFTFNIAWQGNFDCAILVVP